MEEIERWLIDRYQYLANVYNLERYIDVLVSL